MAARRRQGARPRLIEPSKATGESDTEIRLRVYRAIAAHVRETTGGVVSMQGEGLSLGCDILNAVVEIIFRTAIKEGYFKLPAGFGSLKVQELRGTVKKLPTGQLLTLSANRSRLRFTEGTAVKDLLGMPYKWTSRKAYLRKSKLSAKACEAGAFTP